MQVGERSAVESLCSPVVSSIELGALRGPLSAAGKLMTLQHHKGVAGRKLRLPCWQAASPAGQTGCQEAYKNCSLPKNRRMLSRGLTCRAEAGSVASAGVTFSDSSPFIVRRCGMTD